MGLLTKIHNFLKERQGYKWGTSNGVPPRPKRRFPIGVCPIVAALSPMNGHHCLSLPPHPTRLTSMSSVQIANTTSMSLARAMALLIEQNAE